MELLVGHYNAEMSGMDREKEQLWQEATHLVNQTTFQTKEHNLNEHLDQLNRDILSIKEKKLARDRKAFTSGQAYKWHNFQPRRFQGPNIKKGPINKNMDGELSDSSSISSSRSFQGRGNQERWPHKQSKKCGLDEEKSGSENKKRTGNTVVVKKSTTPLVTGNTDYSRSVPQSSVSLTPNVPQKTHHPQEPISNSQGAIPKNTSLNTSQTPFLGPPMVQATMPLYLNK